MTLSRRNFLKDAGGAAVVSGALWTPQAAHSQVSIGAMTLDVVSDGYLSLPGSFAFGPVFLTFLPLPV